jgi:hypothetical protein
MTPDHTTDESRHYRRHWTFNGYEVTRICLDYRVEFQCVHKLPNSGSISIIIGAPFTFWDPTGQAFCDPAESSTVGSALMVLHSPLRSLTAWADGKLEINFGTGVRVVVNKDPQYESWEVVGEGEVAEISMLCTAHDAPPWGPERAYPACGAENGAQF